MIKIRKKVFFILGITSCMVALNIKFQLLNFILIITLIILILENCMKNEIRMKKINLLGIYYLIILFSTIFSLYYGFENFKDNFISIHNIKIFIYLFILFFLKINSLYFKSYINGLKIGIMINFIWAILEFISWKINGFMLNDFIFGQKLGIDPNHAWINYRSFCGNLFLRSCGISWDPGVLGFYCVLGFFIFKRKTAKLLSIFILLLSDSRAGMLALICTILVLKIYCYIKDKNGINVLKIGTISILGIFLLGSFLYFKISDISKGANKLRASYYKVAVLSTVERGSFGLFLFGGSPYYTGNIFSKNPNIKEKLGISGIKNWRVESDWAGILAGRGWIGFIIYIFLYIFTFFKLKSKELKAVVLSVFFLGIGYIYEDSFIANIIYIYIYQNLRNL